MKPTIGRIVIYRSRTGHYSVPAIVTATQDTLWLGGLDRWRETDGREGVPPLTTDMHVHLTVLTPGKPCLRANAEDFEVESPHGRAENVGGVYQEWDVPLDVVEREPWDPQLPGTWRWPERV